MHEVVQFLEHWFWLPLPFSAMHFLWIWFKAYPVYLEARIKDRSSPKPWVYLPSWWKGAITKWASPITLLLSVCVSVTWTGAIARLLPANLIFVGIIFVLVSAGVLWLQRYWLSRNYILQRECYFREYKELAFEYHTKGKTILESDLRNRCMWEHQQSLRRAEQSGRLYRYLQAKAKSKKSIEVLDDNHHDL